MSVLVRPYCTSREFLEVLVNNQGVGMFKRAGERFVATGGRKQVSTMEDAAREVIYLRVKQQMRETARLSAALDEPVTVVDAVARPASNQHEPSPRD